MTSKLLADRVRLLTEPSRAAICAALLDGRAWTVTELADHVGIAAPTASEHLSTLADCGVIAEARQGRHRYVRLADAEVAALVEYLAGPMPEPKSLRGVRAAGRLAAARTCYDHLAGDLGVSIYDALVRLDLIVPTGLTDRGRAWFADLLGPECLERQGRRPLVRECLDWTRRTPHLGGALGAALCTHFITHGWVARSRDDRSVSVTPAGHEALAELLCREADPGDDGAAGAVTG